MPLFLVTNLQFGRIRTYVNCSIWDFNFNYLRLKINLLLYIDDLAFNSLPLWVNNIEQNCVICVLFTLWTYRKRIGFETIFICVPKLITLAKR